MSEPIYSYVKGQGWIPGNDWLVAIDKTGKSWRIHQQKEQPKPGDYFIRVNNNLNFSYYTIGEGINLEKIIDYIASQRSFSKAPDTYYYSSHDYVIMVPID